MLVLAVALAVVACMAVTAFGTYLVLIKPARKEMEYLVSCISDVYELLKDKDDEDFSRFESTKLAINDAVERIVKGVSIKTGFDPVVAHEETPMQTLESMIREMQELR